MLDGMMQQLLFQGSYVKHWLFMNHSVVLHHNHEFHKHMSKMLVLAQHDNKIILLIIISYINGETN